MSDASMLTPPATAPAGRGRARPRLRLVPPAVDAAEAYRLFGTAVNAYLHSQRVDGPEDLLGEVFFQVTRSLHQFQGDTDDLRRWVFTIARHRVIDDRRRRARRPATSTDAVPEAAVEDEDGFDEGLVPALHGLTADQREVVALRFIADLSLEEVAGLTDRTVGATKALQHRALRQLARRLEDLDAEGAPRG
jgi:RNA polymerase sigma-70 factor (ECF subfamily)